ncbi:MAG: hypothetical protein WCO56_11775 [Verrucomicrobiota bacterium]
MPRQLRVEYPGAICHVMSHGDRREDIFHDEVDRQDFLKTLADACQKADFQVHALQPRTKSDPEKVAVAARLRRETTLTIKAIAARLHLGSLKSATTRLQQRKRKEKSDENMPLL